MKNETLRGHEAIEYKAGHDEARLNKYNDPVEEARFDITVEEAEEIASEDPGLIWLQTAVLLTQDEIDQLD